MRRQTVFAMLALLLVGVWAQGRDSQKANVHELRNEIKELRALEKTEVKELGARYDALIVKLKDPEHKLEEIRTELRKQEKTELKHAKTAQQKKAIKQRYEELLKILGNEIKADTNVIKQVKQRKKADERHVKEEFAAKIKELEHEIKSLEKAGHHKSKG